MFLGLIFEVVAIPLAVIMEELRTLLWVLARDSSAIGLENILPVGLFVLGGAFVLRWRFYSK